MVIVPMGQDCSAYCIHGSGLPVIVPVGQDCSNYLINRSGKQYLLHQWVRTTQVVVPMGQDCHIIASMDQDCSNDDTNESRTPIELPTFQS